MAADTEPRWIWHVLQWKYDVDETSHWLTRLFFHYVFLPFNRWSHKHFKLLPFTGNEDLCWIEHQAAFDNEWEAEREATKYRFGHTLKLPLYASLPSETVTAQQTSPNSPKRIQQMYQRDMRAICPRDGEPCGSHDVRVDGRQLVRLSNEVENLFKSKSA